MNKVSLIVLLVALITSCTSPSTKENGSALGLDLKHPKGYVEGRLLFKNRCSACHGETGVPSAKLYPPIKNSDYLQKNQELIPCIISHGLQGKILVNSKEYSMKMPANPDFSAEQIFQLINYINNSWGNNYGETTLEKVKKQLETCAN